MLRFLPALLLVLLIACGGRPEAPVASVEDGEVPVAVADTSVADTATAAVFGRIMDEAGAERWHERASFGEIVQAVGAALLDARYEDGLLDAPDTETLVVNLTAFDCVLFVENVLALAQGIAQEDYSFQGYVRRLEALRYRNGARQGYCSRLHYFTDWIYDNAQRGNVEDVTAAVGGTRREITLDFMTGHRDAYRHLASDSTFACIAGMEASLEGRDLFYIPQDRIAEAYGSLQPGDVIATATDIGGLDVTHTGFVFRSADGGTGFLHASLSSGRVVTAADLEDYVQSHRTQVGIVVARPVDPRPGS